MTEFKAINAKYSVAGQLANGDIAMARLNGFLSVIDNRPDHETGVTISSDEASVQARENALNFVYAPMENHLIYQDETIDRFIAAIDTLSDPVLAYCRTGTRCTILWALAAARFQPAKLVLDHLMANGFEEFDILDDDMADQSRRYFETASQPVVVPEIFKLSAVSKERVTEQSKAA